MLHRNAALSRNGRLRLAICVVVDGWSLRRAAERFQVAPTTAKRWADRYRELGETGMDDGSSRPHASPRRTPTRVERRILKVRVIRRWGPARIGFLLGIAPSTVHKVLTRYRVPRLADLDRASGRAVRQKARRYEHPHPGDLVHVDVMKLGNIPDGGGHKGLSFSQPDATHVREQLGVIAGMLGRQSVKVETMLRDATDDLLAFTGFPAGALRRAGPPTRWSA